MFKNATVYVLLFLLLGSALVKCTAESLPFLDGNYFYWLLVLCVLAVFGVLENKNKMLKINKFDLGLILLSVVGIIHWLFLSKATIYNSEIWNLWGYLLVYFLARNYFSTQEKIKKATQVSIVFCVAIALLNLILMFFQYKGWMESPNEFFVTTGLFFSPNQLGICMSLGFLSSLFLWQKAKNLAQKIELILCGLAILIGLIISESRGAFLSLLAALISYFLMSKNKVISFLNWKVLLGFAVLFIGSFYIISLINKTKTDSTSGRWFTTQQVVNQIIAKPFGYGFDSFSSEYNKAKAIYFEKNSDWNEMKNAGFLYNANNDLLELTFEMGIIWIAIFIGILTMLFGQKKTNLKVKLCSSILLCLLVFSLTSTIKIVPVFVLIACICVALIVNSSDAKPVFEIKNFAVYKSLISGLVLCFVSLIFNRVFAENNLNKLYEDRMYLKGISQVESYIAKIDAKGEEKFMAGVILMKNNYLNEGFDYLNQGFERSSKPSLGRMVALGFEQKKQFDKAEKIYLFNKNVEPYRFEARMDLLNLYTATKQTQKAKKMALEIVNLPVKIRSKKVDGFKNKAKEILGKTN